MAPSGSTGFTIVESRRRGTVRTFVSPDIATCDDCLAELFDPTDRRARYPFTNCTNCGPRFTITLSLPYDRPNTTMRGFALCEACASEYHDPDGPALPRPTDRLRRLRPASMAGAPGRVGSGRRLGRSRRRRPGGARAGGDRRHQGSRRVPPGLRRRLRRRRAATPGTEAPLDEAVRRHGRDLHTARTLARIDARRSRAPGVGTAAHRPAAPAPRPGRVAVSALVAPGNPRLGVLLPYTPLHHLLFAPVPGSGDPAPVPDVLVMTSGNLTDEPICFEDDDARGRLGAIADAWLLHDRPIHVPCDDSVLEIDPSDGSELPLRRSRGYAPLPSAAVLGRPDAGRRGRAEERVLPRGGPGRVHEPAHRRHGQPRDVGRLRTLDPSAGRPVRHPDAGARRRCAPGLPDEAVGRGSAPRGRGRSAAPPRPHRVGDGRARVPPRAGRHRHRVRRDGLRRGRHDLGWGGPRRQLRRVRARRPLKSVPLPGGDAAIRRPCRMALAHLRAAGIEWADDLPPVRRRLDPGAGGAGTPARTRDSAAWRRRAWDASSTR